ncbi:MAG: preQ(1) synthase [Bdellovibrio sp.]|nr:preQ(1) synthase [Bdellovibrio sp.]
MSRSVSKTNPTTSPKTNSRRQGRPEKDLKNLQLGQSITNYPTTYSPFVLESFPNRHPESPAWTTLICPEFTSLCPKTGQPDFAHLTINYIADRKMVESKSLKLYLFSFRNHGDFHEDCIQTICNDLVKLMSPKYIEVIGEFTPRGGISIYPFASYSCDASEYQNLKKQRFLHYAPHAYTA